MHKSIVAYQLLPMTCSDNAVLAVELEEQFLLIGYGKGDRVQLDKIWSCTTIWRDTRSKGYFVLEQLSEGPEGALAQCWRLNR